ncbi:hypothetical protein RJ639_044485 [Escallonia herrerae]|uniref:Reverse transcriptase/retrotransposon-derived protein RNase H-like domain-containing protein n=1 Tax=Escallonia herrerae TaxID=1293975 RepID=A0AA88WDK4_9ASTE|nr:hypothetical protein RJ639_044485 [Escallonia herrerae]
MKIPTENGVGEVKGDQVVARQCYMALCRNRANETLVIEDLRDETKAILKAKDFEWTEECQNSFEELKLYLSSPQLLTKPVTGEDLFLYLSISEVTVSMFIIREEEGKQRHVYYISKVLQDMDMIPSNRQSGPRPCHLSENTKTILPITHRRRID